MTTATQRRSITVVLLGNPNTGKSTLFSALVGVRQRTGNYPGVTVEKKIGRAEFFGNGLQIVDLPGTYSLTPFSIEEIIARDFILEESPDVVVVIIDASNLERSLYLATQIRELDCKVVFCLNMADVARSRGRKIDASKLSEVLDVPVLFTVGNKNEGIDALMKTAIELAESDSPTTQKRRVRYRADIERAIEELESVLATELGSALSYNTRWAAIKLIEDDTIVKKRIEQVAGSKGKRVFEAAQSQRDTLMGLFDEEPEILTTDERYGFIAGIV